MPTYVNFPCKTRQEALECPRGDIVLALCRTCGLITNVAFDPARLQYREGYENSLHYSEVFQRYARSMADRLIERYALENKDIIEIGCGRGDFLYMLCEQGRNRGVGFDPSHTGPPEGVEGTSSVRFVRDLYGERYGDQPADFVCCRHTLEHVESPGELLGPLHRSIGERDTPVFFEVPNMSFILRNRFVWDIIYEHTSYFTPPSLEYAFELAGFRPTDTYASFGGQYLCVEARPQSGSGPRPPGAVDAIAGDVDTFERAYQKDVAAWDARLRGFAKAGKRVVVWGGGSKGITFLNTFDAVASVTNVIDVNPAKSGTFIAGSGQEIVPPGYLSDHPADVIIIVNPIYEGEIRRTAGDLGVNAEFVLL